METNPRCSLVTDFWISGVNTVPYCSAVGRGPVGGGAGGGWGGPRPAVAAIKSLTSLNYCQQLFRPGMTHTFCLLIQWITAAC